MVPAVGARPRGEAAAAPPPAEGHRVGVGGVPAPVRRVPPARLGAKVLVERVLRPATGLPRVKGPGVPAAGPTAGRNLGAAVSAPGERKAMRLASSVGAEPRATRAGRVHAPATTSGAP